MYIQSKRIISFCLILLVCTLVQADNRDSRAPLKFFDLGDAESVRPRTVNVTGFTDNGGTTITLDYVTSPTLTATYLRLDGTNTPSAAYSWTTDLTTTNTITGEQLTSTDDITMQGHLLTLGDDSATDIVTSYKGSANDATITFDESADEFEYGDAAITTTGTVTAEQLTSTDDINAAGVAYIGGVTEVVTGGGGGGSEVFHAKMNDNAANTTVDDSSTNDNDGTLVGGDNTQDISEVGKINDCLHLNGSDDYITADDLITTLALDTEGAVSCWIYIDADDGNRHIFWGTHKTTDTGFNTYIDARVQLDTDTIRVIAKVDGVGKWDWTSAVNVTDDMIGAWTQFTVVHDGTSPVFYKNNSDITAAGSYLVESDKTVWFKDVITDATIKTDNFTIGTRRTNNGTQFYFDGKVDDFRIYSTVLSVANIATLWNSGNGTEASLGGGGGSTAINVSAIGTTSTLTATSLATGQDNLIIEGDLEVDGTVYADGNITMATTKTFTDGTATLQSGAFTTTGTVVAGTGMSITGGQFDVTMPNGSTLETSELDFTASGIGDVGYAPYLIGTSPSLNSVTAFKGGAIIIYDGVNDPQFLFTDDNLTAFVESVSWNVASSHFDISNNTEIDGTLVITPTLTASSGQEKGMENYVAVNQSGTAGYIGQYMNVAENTTGSGVSILCQWTVGGLSRFDVDATGDMRVGRHLDVGMLATAGVDPYIQFTGELNNGLLTWMEGEDYFQFQDDIIIDTTEKLYFRNTNISISSVDDGHLDLTADTMIDLNGTTLATDKIIFTQTDGNEYIDSLADGYIDIGATTGIRLTSPLTRITGDLYVGNNADVDPAIVFDGDTNDGQISYSEDDDPFFIFSDPITLTSNTLLGTPEAGALEYYDGKFYITNVATQRAIDRTSDVAVSTVTVENTTTETTLWTGVMAANSLCAGNMFKFHADGIIQNGGPTAADRITLRIRVGGNVVATLNPIAGAIGIGSHWHIDANATQRTLGAAGPRAVHIDLDVDGTELEIIAVANVNTTANMDVTVTAQWASADVNNIISLYQGFMSYKN